MSRAMAVQLGVALNNDAKVKMIHNAVDVAAFDRPRDPLLRAMLTDGRECPVVLTLARLEPQKGLDTLVAAAEQVRGAVFIVAGDGADRHRLEGEVIRRRLQGRVRFIGHRTDVADLLAACDVFLLPSLFEGLPVSVLEAMAANRPVIASAVAGTDEAVMHGKTGLLVPPADPVALVAALDRVLRDRELSVRMGSAGRARAVALFSTQAMRFAVDRVYRELEGYPGEVVVPPPESVPSGYASLTNLL